MNRSSHSGHTPARVVAHAAADGPRAAGPGAVWNVSDIVAFQASRQPGRLAVVDLATQRRFSYAQLHEAVCRCVSALAALQVGSGERIALLARNSVDLVILHLACSRSGVIFVPLNWRLAASELSLILADSGPRLLVYDAANAELAAAAAGAAGAAATLSLDRLSATIAAAPLAASTMQNADAASILLYTSGTSGRPKGVIVTERNAFFTGINFCLIADVTKDSVLLSEAPMFHVIGLLIGLRACLWQGAAVLVCDGFEPSRTNQRLADPALGVTHYFCVPQMAAMLRADANFAPQRCRALRAIIVGGAPSHPNDVLAWLDDGILMVNGFGMTEIGAGAGMPLDRQIIRARPGSVGLAPPTVTLRVADEDGRELPAGTHGEIWVKGPSVCAGYWNRPEETANAFVGDGWFRTGDIGVRDAENYLTLVDRKKDMFISGGENVFPAEVEVALLAHPEVLEAAVVGVPDPRWGEVGCAVLRLRPGAVVDSETLRAHCVGRIARYKIPTAFLAADTLPRTGSGKVLKHVLRAAIAAGRYEPV